MYRIFHGDSHTVQAQVYSPERPASVLHPEHNTARVWKQEGTTYFWTLRVQFEDEEKADEFAQQFAGSTVFDEKGELLPGIDFPSDPYRCEGKVHNTYPQWFDEDGDLTRQLESEVLAVCSTALAGSLAAKLRWGNEMSKVSGGAYPCIYFWRYET